MFLWHPVDRHIYEIGGQAEGFSPADSTDFAQAVRAKADRAARDIATLRASIRSADDVIRYYAPVSGRTGIHGHVHLGTASRPGREHGPSGGRLTARSGSGRQVNMKDAFAWVPAARDAAEDADSFRSWVMAATQQTRQRFRLPDGFTLPQVPNDTRTLSGMRPAHSAGSVRVDLRSTRRR